MALSPCFLSSSVVPASLTAPVATERGVVQSPPPSVAPGSRSVAAITAAAGLFALGAAAARGTRRNGRVACKGLISYDKEGRARFTAGGGAPAAAAAPVAASKPIEGLGVQAPVGFFDPLGLSGGKSDEEFRRLQSAEIKHGRLAMMATIGFITPYYFKLPGYLAPSLGLKFADVPVGLDAVARVPPVGWAQILVFAAAIEFGQGSGELNEWKVGAPGDYGRGHLGMFGPITDEGRRTRSLNSEIANGRLAMMAITGMIAQNAFTGSTDAMWVVGSS